MSASSRQVSASTGALRALTCIGPSSAALGLVTAWVAVPTETTRDLPMRARTGSPSTRLMPISGSASSIGTVSVSLLLSGHLAGRLVGRLLTWLLGDEHQRTALGLVIW